MNSKESTILTGNHLLLKNLNNSAILNLVRTKAPVSGANLAKMTGMRPSTVQNILKNLEKKGLVINIGTGESTKLGGRPPSLWEIYGNYGYVIGIQLEINEIQAVLVNLNSHIISDYHVENDKFDSLLNIEAKITALIEGILHDNNIGNQQLLGIGIGVSGLVDITRGIILKTSLIDESLGPSHLERLLKKFYDIPIYIENDANAAALAEKWFGSVQNEEHFVFALAVIDREVFGMGFGFILGHDIYRGTNMFAGETYPFKLNIKKILVEQCGYTESELDVGRTSIKIDKLRLSDLIQAIDYDVPVIKLFFDKIGKLIAGELFSIINLLDPRVIVIGGEVAKAKEYIIKPINDAIQKNGLFASNRNLKVVESSLTTNAVPLGAASLILQKIFQGPL